MPFALVANVSSVELVAACDFLVHLVHVNAPLECLDGDVVYATLTSAHLKCVVINVFHNGTALQSLSASTFHALPDISHQCT